MKHSDTKNLHTATGINAYPKFISSIYYLVQLLFFSSDNISVHNDFCSIISFLCWSGFGMLLLGKNAEEASRGPPTHGTRPAPSTPKLQVPITFISTSAGQALWGHHLPQPMYDSSSTQTM